MISFGSINLSSGHAINLYSMFGWKILLFISLLSFLSLHVEAYSVPPYTIFDSAPACISRSLCDSSSVFPSYSERILFVLTNAVRLLSFLLCFGLLLSLCSFLGQNRPRQFPDRLFQRDPICVYCSGQTTATHVEFRAEPGGPFPFRRTGHSEWVSFVFACRCCVGLVSSFFGADVRSNMRRAPTIAPSSSLQTARWAAESTPLSPRRRPGAGRILQQGTAILWTLWYDYCHTASLCFVLSNSLASSWTESMARE